MIMTICNTGVLSYMRFNLAILSTCTPFTQAAGCSAFLFYADSEPVFALFLILYKRLLCIKSYEDLVMLLYHKKNELNTLFTRNYYHRSSFLTLKRLAYKPTRICTILVYFSHDRLLDNLPVNRLLSMLFEKCVCF